LVFIQDTLGETTPTKYRQKQTLIKKPQIRPHFFVDYFYT